MTEPPDLEETTLDASTADGPMAVLHKRPTGSGPWPLVAFFHDGPGIRDATHVVARRLAEAGYEVVVPDLYHRHGRLIGYGPEEMAANPDLRQEIMRMVGSIDDDEIQADLDGALAVVDADRSSKKGCIGFCLGGRAVFRTMMRLPDEFVAGSMWHPSFLVVDDDPASPHLTASELSGSLYVGMGDADQVMSVERTQPFLDAVDALGDHVRVDIHPGADHGYTFAGSPNYDQAAAETSWTATLDLFAHALR